MIDLNQIKFDEEFDIYKIKEDNKDTRIVSKRENLYFCSCIAKTTCCHIVAVKLYNNEPIEYLISGNISIAVFQKNEREKMGRKMKGHKKNSQPTRTIGSVASNIIDSESESEIDPKEILIRKCLEMIRISDAEEGSKLIRKTDLKNMDDIEYRIEFNEIDLEEFKSYFNKKAWEIIYDFFKSKKSFYVCSICRVLCNVEIESIMCSSCNFFYHYKCIKRNRNLKKLICNSCNIYKERNNL